MDLTNIQRKQKSLFIGNCGSIPTFPFITKQKQVLKYCFGKHDPKQENRPTDLFHLPKKEHKPK